MPALMFGLDLTALPNNDSSVHQHQLSSKAPSIDQKHMSPETGHSARWFKVQTDNPTAQLSSKGVTGGGLVNARKDADFAQR